VATLLVFQVVLMCEGRRKGEGEGKREGREE